MTYPFRFVCLLVVDCLSAEPNCGIRNDQQKNDPKHGEKHRRRTRGYPRHGQQKLFFFLSCCRDIRKEAPAAHKERRSTNGKTLLKEKLFILTSAVSSVSLGDARPNVGLPPSLSREEDETFSVIAPCYNKWKGKSETTKISMRNGQLKIAGTKRTDERERERVYGFFLIV